MLFFGRKCSNQAPVQGPPDQHLVVKNCWPKKKTRLGGCRKKKPGPGPDAVLDVAVQANPVPNAVLDVAVQVDSVPDAVLDVAMQADPILDAVLDIVVQADPVLDVVVQTEAKLAVEVQTEEVLDDVLQTEEPVCVEEVHSPKEALGHAVGRPSDSDAKRTKRMSVIIGVEPTPVEPKPTTNKFRGHPKGSGKTKKK
jgi:hypothetical protein